MNIKEFKSLPCKLIGDTKDYSLGQILDMIHNQFEPVRQKIEEDRSCIIDKSKEVFSQGIMRGAFDPQEMVTTLDALVRASEPKSIPVDIEQYLQKETILLQGKNAPELPICLYDFLLILQSSLPKIFLNLSLPIILEDKQSDRSASGKWRYFFIHYDCNKKIQTLTKEKIDIAKQDKATRLKITNLEEQVDTLSSQKTELEEENKRLQQENDAYHYLKSIVDLKDPKLQDLIEEHKRLRKEVEILKLMDNISESIIDTPSQPRSHSNNRKIDIPAHSDPAEVEIPAQHYTVEYYKGVESEIKKLDSKYRNTLEEWMERMKFKIETNPRDDALHIKDISKQFPPKTLRYKISRDLRIAFSIHDESRVVTILKVGLRRDFYNKNNNLCDRSKQIHKKRAQ
ncbi:hypothetical protein PVA45_01580 [Entomospira entomophila]|uniref:Uncharacterized protein n=1 Tax=Entomospira entomophila TaxID=2719988 RepID=A0A968G7W6_9SPIO|nr:hypothetical protein [Entomospira entomophilus]NIZ40203.1 hypothetical protein [Entomospira entomophilus]WDI35762.1 hypothetical protein PVA45_01580 [Entomospira entomophilus]